MANRPLFAKYGLVVCFLLGNSPASEFYMPTFRNTLSHLHRQVGVKWLNLRIVWGIHTGEGWLENSLSRLEGGWGVGVGPVTKQVVKRVTTHMWVVTPFTTCFVTEPIPTPSPSFQSAQAVFEPTFSRMDAPNYSQIIHHTPTLRCDIPVVWYKYHKMKRNRSLNTTNGLLSKMESTYVITYMFRPAFVAFVRLQSSSVKSFYTISLSTYF